MRTEAAGGGETANRINPAAMPGQCQRIANAWIGPGKCHPFAMANAGRAWISGEAFSGENPAGERLKASDFRRWLGHGFRKRLIGLRSTTISSLSRDCPARVPPYQMVDRQTAAMQGRASAVGVPAPSRDCPVLSRDRHALRFVTQRYGNGPETFLKRFIDAEATHRRPCAIGSAAWGQIESDAGATHRRRTAREGTSLIPSPCQADTLPLSICHPPLNAYQRGQR